LHNLKLALLAIISIMLINDWSFAESSEQRPNNSIQVSFNGTFVNGSPNEKYKIVSENHLYGCSFQTNAAEHENRRLSDFRMYKNDILQYQFDQAPGSDLMITNSGIALFFDHTFNHQSKLIVKAISSAGNELFSKMYKSANGFVLSPDGNQVAIRNHEKIEVVSLLDGQYSSYPKGYEFALSENAEYIIIAATNKLDIYHNSQLIHTLNTSLNLPRQVAISKAGNLAAVIDKRTLRVYDLATGHELFEKATDPEYSYRDLKIIDGMIYVGIHQRNKAISKGLLRRYSGTGDLIDETSGTRKFLPDYINQPGNDNATSDYEQIPWPFMPFDSIAMVWNYYEQHMGGWSDGFSYLHQGLDIITPVNEPTFAVQEGIVKCVLTLGGDAYWRTAISPAQSEGRSAGWLYAHLVANSLQFDIGDTVNVHDYIGDIVYWSDDWGHIHFVEITDSGTVWQYDDDEWGINFNPLLALTPSTDTIAPVIEDVFPGLRFAICVNQTSDYLLPDSVYGEIDIISKIYDYMNNSPYQQPAYETFYWITKYPEGDTVVNRTLGQILNHAYDFYAVDPYEPFAKLLYKHDDYLQPSSWMDTLRNYHHILTNNNSDSLALLEEAELALNTALFADGWYYIYVEARDRMGNSAIDSRLVHFANEVTGIENKTNFPNQAVLFDNYPNPFNNSTLISFFVPQTADVSLSVYDIAGREVMLLVHSKLPVGKYQERFDGASLSSGIYFYRLQVGDQKLIKKMALIR